MRSIFLETYDLGATRVSATLGDDLAGKSKMLRRMQAGWGDLSDDDWQKITTCYLAQLTFLDSEMGRILEVLRQSGCYEDTIVLFLADHGRMLGAHGLVGLGLGLAYEEVYNVPLFVRVPPRLLGKAANARGREVNDALVSLVDVGPTLLDLCGLAPLPDAQGRSLKPLIEGRYDAADWRDAYGEFFAQRFMYEGADIERFAFWAGEAVGVLRHQSAEIEARSIVGDSWAGWKSRRSRLRNRGGQFTPWLW